MKWMMYLLTFAAALGLVLLPACREASPPVPPPKPAPPKVQEPTAPSGPSPAQQAQAKLVAELASDPTATVSQGFVLVPPGRFRMGTPNGEIEEDWNDAPVHEVVLTHAFEIQKTEVTQAQYAWLVGLQPDQDTKCPDCPVANVSWFQAAEYCNQLSRQKNLPMCHTLSATDATFEGLTCRGYRLPTEAEWEYAARAGTAGPRFGPTDEVAWVDSNSSLKAHPVGQKKPNPWGILDPLGNVCEWTQDWMGDYPAGPVTDPVGPATGQNRVFRGGSFQYPDVESRAGFRNAYGPGNRVDFIGFRCVRTVGR